MTPGVDSVAGCTLPMSANRFTVACCIARSVGPPALPDPVPLSRPHAHCTVPEPNTRAPLGPRCTLTDSGASSSNTKWTRSSASAKSGLSCAEENGCRPASSRNCSRKSRAAFSRAEEASGSAALSLAEVAASMRVSRASSMSWLLDTLSPKNRLAVSGNWWASSKITVLHAGRSSATPSSRNTTSAKNR